MKETSISYAFIVLASVVIVLAGVKSAASIIIPFLLALFFTIILTPMFGWLNRKGLPEGLSLLSVMLLFIGVLVMMGMLIGSSIHDFNANIPVYTKQLEQQLSGILGAVKSLGIDLPDKEITQAFDPKVLMKYAAGTLKSVSAMVADGFVILLMVIFMLLETGQFVEKINIANGNREGIRHFYEVTDKIKHYMALKAVFSLMTGALVSVMLMFFGVDYAFLWGVVAFMFNFIPNIGSIIAAVPAVLLAWIQLGSLSALLITAGYVVINILIGSVVEPKVMGKGLGLSTLVVFLSLIFWGWLLGPVGMLLSIPLTIMVKIALDARENTRWIAVMLGSAHERRG